MKAVAKSTSNGEPLHGQSRAELRGNAKKGVETCVNSYRVVSGMNRGVVLGVEPRLLNGGCNSLVGTNAGSSCKGIVRSSEQSETHLLQTRDVQ
jgi:hypothetical protein